MSRFAALVAGCCLLVTALPAEEPAGAEVGKNLPGTFQPFNVNAAIPLSEEPEAEPKEKDKGAKPAKYSSKNKFHCLVTEYDLDPVVMLVARGLDDNAAFRDLLTKLDAAIDRNKFSRLRCFVVFQDPALGDVVTEDDKRDEIVRKLDKLALDAKLKNVVVALAGKDDLAKYKLDPAAALTAILYRKLRVEAIHKVGADKLEAADGPEAKAILADVGAKLGAKR